jgi:hypothetical protein
VSYPFTDLTGGKLRPAIVLTASPMIGRDAHFVFLSTQPPPPGLPAIEVKEGSIEARTMNLRFPPGKPSSFIYPTKVTTLDRVLVQRLLGTTPPELLQRITEQLARSLGITA